MLSSLRPPKRVAVDFDGTLCEQAYPHIGPPKPGAREALALLRKLGYVVIIWTCRTCHWDYDVYGGDPGQPTLERDRVKEMVAWLAQYGMEYDVIDDGSKGKPSADFYIDDKAVRFADNWPDIAIFVTSREFLQLNIEPVNQTDQEEGPFDNGTKRCRVIPFRIPRTGVHQPEPPPEDNPFPPQVA